MIRKIKWVPPEKKKKNGCQADQKNDKKKWVPAPKN